MTDKIENDPAEQLLDRIYEAIDADPRLYGREILSALVSVIVGEIASIQCPDCRASVIKDMRKILPQALRDAEAMARENDREDEEAGDGTPKFLN